MKPSDTARLTEVKNKALKKAGRASKKARNLYWTRELLDSFDEQNSTSILNTIYSVSPVAFDPPEIQKKIHDLYPKPADLNLSLFALNMMRLHRKSRARKIVVCSMPKSGSTFVLTSLMRLEKLKFNYGYLHVPYTNPSFVDAVPNENEIDELALLVNEILDRPILVHTHTKNSVYTGRLLGTHRYKPIVVQRNIFDCIVSMDDMAMSEKNFPGFGMFHPPATYNQMPREDRLAFLTQYVGPWYVDFVASWNRSRLEPVFLNYDADIRGFDKNTAEKLRGELHLDGVTTDEILDAFQLKNAKDKDLARFNKGESGRGADIPQHARDAIRRLADVYSSEVDFSGLI